MAKVLNVVVDKYTFLDWLDQQESGKLYPQMSEDSKVEISAFSWGTQVKFVIVEEEREV